jgi:thiol-disulfide isomerase/thioredoxin
MKKTIATFILIMLSTITLMAESSTVSGKIINGKGLTIRLMTYGDQVTYLRETLASCQLGDDEQFHFIIENNAIKYVWLDIEFQQAEMFIQPGQSYEIEIELKNLSISTSYYNRTVLPIKIIKDDSDNLNLYIQDFNQLYNDFMLSYADNARSHSSGSMFDTFIKAINMRFQNAANPYFMSYIRYKTASMQLFLRLKSRDNIGFEYFTGKPVLYENIEYMDFFHLFFEKYFLAGAKFFSYNKTYDLVNGSASSVDILDSLKADPVLKDAELRELLLLDGLKDLYNVSGFKRNRIILLVEEISMNGSTVEIRKVAQDVLIRLRRLHPGSPAPEFSLSGFFDGKKYQLADFREKYIYLAFFESGNPACQSELGMITDLYKEFKNKVAFIAVSVDKDPGKLAAYLKQAELPWLVLQYGGNLELLENYDASTYPYFILIDGKGQIVSCPAPSPSENLKKILGSI